MDSLPIGEYALLSDCRSAALVSRDGSVDWLCFPRFDRPSVFCRLLDAAAGHFSIRPPAIPGHRRYVDQTLVLETTFTTAAGTAVLTDALAVGRNERGHDLGAGPPALLRLLACTRGEIEAESATRPGRSTGSSIPLLVASRRRARRPGRRRPAAAVDAGQLRRGRRHRDRHGPAGRRAGRRVRAGHRASWPSPPRPRGPQEEITDRLDDTLEGWRSWSAIHQNYEGPWRELVHHTGRVLQALTFAPTGAIVAAPTTSLPETVGGERNWDYRYTWVRDASLTMEALWVAACPDEANKFFAFLANAAGSAAAARRRPADHVRHRRRAGPDRAGAAAPGGLAGQPPGAGRQRRVAPAAARRVRRAARRRAPAGRPARRARPGRPAVPGRAADTAAARWREKDQGIWEIRGEPRDFLYSKLMCWVALDRAIDAGRPSRRRGPGGGLGGRPRRDPRRPSSTRGWSERAGAFTQSFGSDDLDASSLMLPIVGFLPADDPRMLATIDAIAQRLTDERGLVYRYRGPRRPGGRGGHVPAVHVLAGAGAGAGRRRRAGPRGLRAGRRASSTTSACSPRRSTRAPASCSATSRRRSATSA